jgi:hypothetical protein
MEKYVNGNKPSKETLIDRQADYIPQSDYNEKIYELMIDKETRDIERLEAIRTICDLRRRLILAAILVGIPQQKIASICHIDQAVISKIYHGHR